MCATVGAGRRTLGTRRGDRGAAPCQHGPGRLRPGRVHGLGQRQVFHVVDGQADTIDGDGALVDEKAGQGLRRQDLQQVALAHWLEAAHHPQTIHMPRHQMTSHPVRQAHGLLQIDRPRAGQAGGAAQALGRHIHDKAVSRLLDHRHAGALDGNGITDGNIRHVQLSGGDIQPDAILSQRGYLADAADGGDDTCEHGLLPALGKERLTDIVHSLNKRMIKRKASPRPAPGSISLLR